MKSLPSNCLLCLLLWLVTGALAHATVDEAYDHAMEAALPYVEKGYIVRQDYWNGEVESGQKLAVRHQLFKGNDYVFWLGASNADTVLELAVYDAKGNPVHMERKDSPYTATVRVNPPRTGTYTVVFSVTSKKNERGVTWALAYGYQ